MKIVVLRCDHYKQASNTISVPARRTNTMVVVSAVILDAILYRCPGNLIPSTTIKPLVTVTNNCDVGTAGCGPRYIVRTALLSTDCVT